MQTTVFRKWMILAVCCCMPAVSLQAARVIEPIQTVSEPLGLDPGIVALGDRLFHDLRLSRNNTVSCAHCHRLNAGGDDDMPVSIGIEGKA
ncbi:cytochrome-c peroxidase, partial [Thiolapillus sp.]